MIKLNNKIDDDDFDIHGEIREEDKNYYLWKDGEYTNKIGYDYFQDKFKWYLLDYYLYNKHRNSNVSYWKQFMYMDLKSINLYYDIYIDSKLITSIELSGYEIQEIFDLDIDNFNNFGEWTNNMEIVKIYQNPPRKWMNLTDNLPTSLRKYKNLILRKNKIEKLKQKIN